MCPEAPKTVQRTPLHNTPGNGYKTIGQARNPKLRSTSVTEALNEFHEEYGKNKGLHDPINRKKYLRIFIGFLSIYSFKQSRLFYYHL